MLKLYHHHISANSRRVWIALLEKNLPFEGEFLQLNGDQFEPEFEKLNPFHHVPVLLDDDFRVVESLAILDYLEAKYPQPSLLPQDPQDLAIVRMVEMITVNELFPAMNPLISHKMGFGQQYTAILEQSAEKINTILEFLAEKLGDRPFFGSESLTVADIVAGCAVPLLPWLGVELEPYPQLHKWSDSLSQRPAWQETQPSEEMLEKFKEQMKVLMSKQAR